MELYKIYNYERDVLIRQNMENGTKYNPVVDKKGDYFITKLEHKLCGLGVLTEFVPPTPTEII